MEGDAVLVEVTDVKGRVHWINPLYVRCVREHKPGVTLLIGSVSAMGSQIKVREEARSLADRVSAAMPESAAMAALADEEMRRQQQQGAAAAGVTAAG